MIRSIDSFKKCFGQTRSATSLCKVKGKQTEGVKVDNITCQAAEICTTVTTADLLMASHGELLEHIRSLVAVGAFGSIH